MIDIEVPVLGCGESKWSEDVRGRTRTGQGGVSERDDSLVVREFLLLIEGSGRSYIQRLRASLKKWQIIIEKIPRRAAYPLFRNEIDLVLMRCTADASDVELLGLPESVRPSVPVVILSDWLSEDLARRVLRHGACGSPRIDPAGGSATSAPGDGGGREESGGPGGIPTAVDFICRNLASGFTLSQIARECGMSVSSFERAFKRETGTTYKKYVCGLRISRAAEMLRHDSLPVGEIAFSCGYNSACHFSRTFRRAMGVSPRAYRNTTSGGEKARKAKR